MYKKCTKIVQPILKSRIRTRMQKNAQTKCTKMNKNVHNNSATNFKT